LRKKSLEKSCYCFCNEVKEIKQFLDRTVHTRTPDLYVSWLYNYAVIQLYRQFEAFILDCLIGLINNDTQALSDSTGYNFPKHLSDEICEYLIIGNGYFDFRGRDGLINTLKKYLPVNHWFIVLIKKPKYKDTLNQLSALRNYAAHESGKSKKAALKAVDQKRISTAGAWLKRQKRFDCIADKLVQLSGEIETSTQQN